MTDRGKPHLAPTRLDAVVTAFESLMAHGYFLHGADGTCLDREALIQAMRVALDAAGPSNPALEDVETDLRLALDESLKLQAHYAELLNMQDGGKRHIFNSVDEWIGRLREVERRES